MITSRSSPAGTSRENRPVASVTVPSGVPWTATDAGKRAPPSSPVIRPVIVAVPLQGLSIPNVPDGPFWNPAADRAFLETLEENLHDNIELLTYENHVNDPQFGEAVAELFINLMSKE